MSQIIATWSQTQPNTKLLLVIDQFEELITIAQEHQSNPQTDKEWQSFLTMLRVALASHRRRLHTVLTLRSDFEPRFLDSPLKAHWRRGRFPVRAMTSDELRQAIEGPALKQALYFEPPDLVGKLIDEVGQMPGALPLLSFTLSELYINLTQRWRNSTERALKLEDYTKLGGVAGSLTRRATEEYEQIGKDKTLGEARQRMMRRVMLRMVAIEGGGVARRRVPKSELVYSDNKENERIEQIVKRLVEVRLLVTGQEVRSRTAGRETIEAYIEPAHDFLVNGWEKLQIWIEEEQEQLVLRQRLNVAANAWIRREGSLWIEEADRLIKLNEIIDSSHNWLNRLETIFVRRSSKVRQDRIKKLERDLQISEQRRAKAEVREKAARAENFLSTRSSESLLLAIQAVGQNLEELSEEVLSPVQVSLRSVLQSVRSPYPFQKLKDELDFSVSIECATISPTPIKTQKGYSHIIAAGVNTKVWLWDLQGSLVGQSLEEGKGSVTSLAFSPNGKMIAFGDRSRLLQIWDLQSNIQRALEGHLGEVECLIFSPNSKLIAASTSAGIWVWNLRGKLITNIEGNYAVAFSPDNRILATNVRGNVQLWNLKGKPLKEAFEGHTNIVTALAFSPDGKYIASASRDNTVRLWNLKDNSKSSVFKGHKDEVSSVVFSPIRWATLYENYYVLASGSKDGTIRLWSTGGNLIEILKWEKNLPWGAASSGSEVQLISFSSDSKLIVATGGSSDGFRLWDLQDLASLKVCIGHHAVVNTVACSPTRVVTSTGSNYIIASGSSDGTVRLWDLQGSPIGQPFSGHEWHIQSVAFSSDSKIIASAADHIRLWDLEGNLLNVIAYHGSIEVTALAFSPVPISIASKSIYVLAAGDSSGKIRLWDIDGNSVGQILEGHKNTVKSVAFSPDGTRIVSGGEDCTVKLWDLQGSSTRQDFQGHGWTVNSVAFSPDGKMVASGSADSTIRLWDLQGNPIEQPFGGHTSKVESIAFSPDGKMLVSGSEDYTIRLWDLQGNLIGEPIGHHMSYKVAAVTFSPDGDVIVSGGGDYAVRLWRVGWRAWLKICCNRLRHYSASQNPQTEMEKKACETCQEYIWGKSAL